MIEDGMIKPPPGIPIEIYQDYLTIIVAAQGPNDGEINERMAFAIAGTVDRLCAKHLSDSPCRVDKQRLVVELLETALAIAKGEKKL